MIQNKTVNSPSGVLAFPLNAEPDLVRNIGGTTFDIYVHFSDTSRETFTDKVVRLIQNEPIHHVADEKP